MRVRTFLIAALVVGLGLVGVLPQATYAQEETGSTQGRLYLPALSNPTGREQTGTDTTLTTVTVSTDEQAAAEAFWTRERMLEATPLDQVQATAAQAAAAQAATAAGLRRGPKGAAAGNLPEAKALGLAQSLYAAEWARIAADEAVPEAPAGVQGAAADDADAFASTPPFTSYFVNDNSTTWKFFPWVTMGRLFFQIPGLSGTYACTGAAAYGRAVWTAGHCVYSPGRGWHTNMYFVPAYRNGAYPYGSFTVKSKTALNEWVTTGNLAYDIGMVAVNDKSGLKLSQWVGSVGFMWNQNGTQLFHAFGYPANYSSGQYLVVCAASTFKRDPLNGPYPIGIGCDQGSGSSGGPWLVGYAPFKGGNTNYINGLNAYTYGDKPNELYGPYFGDGAKTLYDWAQTQ